MMNLIAIVSICILCVGFAMVPSSDALFHDRPCSVRINSIQVAPVTYDSQARENPDGSVYPGDGIHFIFKFSGSETCQSFQVKPLVSSENLNIRSALIISGTDSTRPHSVIVEKWIPKHLTTFHWYEIVRYTEPYPHNHHCKCAIHIHTDPIFSDNPIFSYREDVKLSSSDAKKIDHYRKSDKYQKTETQSWHLVKEMIPYNVGVDKHVLEDNNSVNSFVNIINSNCSNLSKNQGCVFGHIEIPTITNDKKQTCLFEELDSLGVPYGIVWSEGKETRTYGGSSLVDHCIPNDAQNKLNITVSGTGISCDGDGKCKSYVRKDNSSVIPHILSSFGEISFEYLDINDLDGFPYYNKDGTYYPYDVLGIRAIPEVQWKADRDRILSFQNFIYQNTITGISQKTCNEGYCDVLMNNDKISPDMYSATNGDLMSTHYSNGILGNATITHTSKVYNIERYIGEYTGVAKPLIVCYTPIIPTVHMWSYLTDGGSLSFENRYSAALKYDGSRDCKDSSEVYEDRRVKITDFYAAFVQTDHFESIFDVASSEVVISDITSIADMNIFDSVRDRINNHTMPDFFDGPTVHLNLTSQKVQVDSAGFSRILLDVPFNDKLLEENYINVTAHNTFSSINFGGVNNTILVHEMYHYPFGYFTAPFNVTAYKYTSDIPPCRDEFCTHVISVPVIDEDVNIGVIKITDVDDPDFPSITLPDYYIYHYRNYNVEFSYMRLSDIYQMNIPQKIDSYTGEFQLNKTAIYYHKDNQQFLLENGMFGNSTYTVRENLMNVTPKLFPLGPYSISAEITASRDGVDKTNVVDFYGLYLQREVKYVINLHPDNYIPIHRVTTAVSIPQSSHFGNMSSISVNGIPKDDVSCGLGCVLVLPNEKPVSITVENDWGGKINDNNLTAIIQSTEDEQDRFELLPMRLFWIGFALMISYVVYRGLKMMFAYKKGNKM